MRVAFAGTPEFARVALDAVLDAGFTVPLALTQPDRPAGRGLKLQASPVKQCAQAHGLPLAQPRSLRLDGRWPEDARDAEAALQAAAPDVIVVAAYGLILPPWVLALPAHGCLNIHASLLPRWRGAAPIHRAIEAGDAVTGITIMQMDAGLDTGPMLLAESLPITAADSTATLHDRLAALGARLVVQALRALAAGTLQPTAQPAHGACYAHKVEKAEAAIDWSAPAALIERRVRAFDPFPGASFEIDGQPVKLWRARCVDGPMAPGLSSGMAPGTVLEAGNARLVVACSEGALELRELQRTGGRRVGAAQLLHGHPVTAGRVLVSGTA
ncbi:MAG TPA: methionyl-tRNA formyltransferase [Rubrivivax sp.]|nr:methionyl-tRNA formyltransferase [Rubrivivax sp.]